MDLKEQIASGTMPDDEYLAGLFHRTTMLLGQEGMAQLRGKTVAVAGCGGGDPRADRHHLGRELMAEDLRIDRTGQRVRARRRDDRSGDVLVQVGTADAARGYLDHDITRTRSRIVDRGHLDLVGSLDDYSSHAATASTKSVTRYRKLSLCRMHS